MPLAGRPLVGWAVERAAACRGVSDVVVVAPSSHLPQVRSAYAGCVPDAVAVHLVPGGAERSDSVAAGLAALPAAVDVVLVHDAARGLTPTSLFDAVAEAVHAGHPAVIPGLAVSDTIKQVDADERVVGTLPRAGLRAVQTPQGFRRAVLEQAHTARVGAAVTDDATMVEALGEAVLVVAGDPLAHKVTTPADLALVEAMMNAPHRLTRSERP